MNDSERIADFIIRTGYEDLPAEARQVARMCITDTLGTALAASREAIARIIIDYVGTFRGEPTCTIAGSPLRAPAPLAALANGTLAHALDYDDIDWNIIGHPSVAIVPAVLSLGEDLGASGKELITAYLVGLEVEGKLGVCLNPDHYEQGWHSTSTLGTFGAAAASAKLVKLSPEEAQHALGIAASMAGGLIKNFGTMTKPLHAGLAAQQGVMAAQLARRGFTASREIFHGDMNFSQVFSGGKRPNIQVLDEGMGNPFEAISPGIVFKQYPSCGSTHPAIDALLSLRKEHKLRPEDVERVECAMDYRRRSVLLYDRPETGLQGKFSMQFCLAVALLEGQMGLRQVTDEKVRDPAVRSWMERMEVYVHPEQKTQESLKNRFIDVKVVTRDGRELAKRVYKAKGNPEVPLSAEELTAKFRDCASIALPVDQVESCLKLLSRLEELEDTRWLMNTCRQEI